MKHLFPFALLLATALPLRAQRVVPYGPGVGMGTLNKIAAVYNWDDKLVMGGRFNNFLGHATTNLCAWDGTQFYDFPGAWSATISRTPEAIIEHDGQLVVGGGDLDVDNIARWDGSAWQLFDQGYPSRVYAIEHYEGDLVIAGGYGRVCRWNGATWDTLGQAFDDVIYDLAVYNGELYAAGNFDTLGTSTTLRHLARWNGTDWEEVLNGLNDDARTMELTSWGLAVGGYFTADGDGALALPYWTFYNGTAFTIPDYAPDDNVSHIKQLSTGELVLRAGRASAVMHDGTTGVFDYADGPTGEYNGSVLLARGVYGYVPIQEAEAPINGLVQLLLEGRQVAHVDAGGVDARLTPTPWLFNDWSNNLPGFLAPKTDTAHAVYTVTPWLLGKQNGSWYSSWPVGHNAGDSALFAGPTANVYDTAFYHHYHQLWSITQGMIDTHADRWDEADYNMPYAIRSWPGNGNTSNGEAAQLAPFHDADNDGQYEPAQGDWPLIRGDQAAYWILHGERDVYGGLQPLRFDMHVLAYAYEDPAEGMDRYQSVFANFRMINRSGAAYDSLRFGVFGDMDIGGYSDDLAECDSTRNLIYAYNADDDDANEAGVYGYGVQPPAAGVMFLNATMNAHRAWPNTQDPTINRIDAMNGELNGAPFTEPGYPTHFQFPGGSFSDAYDAGAVERRNLGSTGPFTWNADATLCFDIAVMHARATSGGPYASVATLKQRADVVQAWYDSEDFDCAVFENVVGVREQSVQTLGAYPNPAGDVVTLTLARAGTQGNLLLYDARGAVVLRQAWPSGNSTVQLDLHALESGIYLVELVTPEGRTTSRLVRMAGQ